MGSPRTVPGGTIIEAVCVLERLHLFDWNAPAPTSPCSETSEFARAEPLSDGERAYTVPFRYVAD